MVQSVTNKFVKVIMLISYHKFLAAITFVFFMMVIIENVMEYIILSCCSYRCSFSDLITYDERQDYIV